MDCRPSQTHEQKGEVMKGYLLLVLLVATSVAQTAKTPDKKTEPEPTAVAAKKHVKTEAVKAQKAAPAKTKSAEAGTAEAQAEAKNQPGQTEVAQAKTEAGPEEEPQAQTSQDPKLTSVPGGKALGMSILGNQEAPTSLVIVPWKSSEVGRATGISPMLDDSRQPVDKEVFMRELRYYEIRSEKKP
jgi:type IV secretory pathway VirB10-like protein